MVPSTAVPERAYLAFGGVRVASTDHQWNLRMGQKPDASPVNITLDGRGPIILEGWQRSSFNHRTALLTCPAAWIGLAVDRSSPAIGSLIQIGYDDVGPLGNSLQPGARLRSELPAGTPIETRACIRFGVGTPVEMDPVGGWLNRPAYVPYVDVVDSPPPAAERLRELLDVCDPVILVPKRELAAHPDVWNRLGERLGAHVQSQESFEQYLAWYAGYEAVKRFPPVLMIVVGEPGENDLLDERNRERRFFSRYPLRPPRHAIRLVEHPDPPGHMLFVFGNGPEGTAAGCDELFAMAGERPSPPPLSVAPKEWSNRMPFSFQGIRDRGESARAVAFRNGYAEHLFLVRANRNIEGLRVVAPAGIDVRSIPWRYGEGVSPFHDAAFPGVPDRLARTQQLGLWLSRRIPADADAGEQTAQVTVRFDGGQRVLTLTTEILPLRIADRYPIGFYPMGGGREEFKRYFQWDDDEAYYRHLPNLLRRLHEFGTTYYPFDVEGLTVAVTPEGGVAVDVSRLKREYEAAMAGAPLQVCEVHSLNHILHRQGAQLAAQREDLADEFDAWYAVIAPAIRQALEQNGLAGRFVCRHADEIGDYERWLPNARAFRRAGFGMTVAINGYGVNNHKLGVGTMTLWMPLFNFYCNRWGHPIADDEPDMFNANFRDARLAAGESIWPYVCGPGPYVYGPRPRSYGRFLLLDGYLKKATGITYYGGMTWTHAVSPGYRKTQAADLFGSDCTFVSLFYPDAASGELLPTTRAVVMRMGMEDAAAIAAIRERAKSTPEAKLAELAAPMTMEATDVDGQTFRRGLNELYESLAR